MNSKSLEVMDYLKGKTVSNVVIDAAHVRSGIYQIKIHFEDSLKHLIMYAAGDCCSCSWFETLNGVPFDTLKGKKIKNIVTKETIEMPPSAVQECDANHLIEIEFDNDSENFKFVLRNSSNGYYDGWLELSLAS